MSRAPVPDGSALVAQEQLGPVRVLTLNRPARRNALVPELLDALGAALGEERPARAVVLTGSAPAFCVGADLAWLGAGRDPAEGVARLVAAHHATIRAMLDCPGPIVAAVNGAAAGGGLSLALAADYRVASAAATFTAAYTRLALPPDGGSSAFLARMLGTARAMDLLLRNRTLSAADALAWGLVNEVVEPGTLRARACAVAEELGPVPASTLLATRRLLDAAGSQPVRSQLQQEAVAMREAARSEHFRRALRAFLERRG